MDTCSLSSHLQIVPIFYSLCLPKFFIATETEMLDHFVPNPNFRPLTHQDARSLSCISIILKVKKALAVPHIKLYKKPPLYNELKGERKCVKLSTRGEVASRVLSRRLI